MFQLFDKTFFKFFCGFLGVLSFSFLTLYIASALRSPQSALTRAFSAPVAAVSQAGNF